MDRSVVVSQYPEEREYLRYLGEIDLRKRRVAELRLDLEVTHERLGQFNTEYHARVGALYVELDKINLSMAEYEYRIRTIEHNGEVALEDVEQRTREQFFDQREHIHHGEEETTDYERRYHQDRQRQQLDDQSQALLRSLYRDLAKRLHPDLARTDEERIQREAIMRRVNAAFHDRDIQSLQSIGMETVSDDPVFEALSIGEKLVWAIREVSRLDEVIAATTEDIDVLMGSELAKLWKRQSEGENVIERLERRVRQDIERTREQLHLLIDGYRQLSESQIYDQSRP